MEILSYNTETPVKDLHGNQYNPRHIKDSKLNKLIRSIHDFPKMLEVRPIIANEDGQILAGNMRFKAIMKMGLETVPAVIVKATEKEQDELVVKDNLSFGEWDWDDLLNNYDEEQLSKFGFSEFQIKGIYGDLEIHPPHVNHPNTQKDPEPANGTEPVTGTNNPKQDTVRLSFGEFFDNNIPIKDYRQWLTEIGEDDIADKLLTRFKAYLS